jgi:hypothetical protein
VVSIGVPGVWRSNRFLDPVPVCVADAFCSPVVHRAYRFNRLPILTDDPVGDAIAAVMAAKKNV